MINTTPEDPRMLEFVARDVRQMIRIAAKYVTQDRLKSLFALPDGIVVANREGDEITPQNGQYNLLSNPEETQFLVFPEEALDDESSEEHQTHEQEGNRSAMLHERVKAMEVARKKLIQELYKPLHPHLFQLSENIFLPSFRAAIKDGSQAALMKILKKEAGQTRLYSFDMLAPEFCSQLIEEAEHFERSGLPVMRPNSMNNYGVILDEIGFSPFLQELMLKWVAPLASLLYPDYGGASLDNHHGFIVQYKIGEDTNLGFHYDESEVTLNVCLGRQFTGGSLYFRGLLLDPSTHSEKIEINHQPGRALIHIGKHRHGANRIKSGERYNLILWCTSSSYQASRPTCSGCSGCEGHEADAH